MLKLDGRAGAKEMGDESREEGAQEGKGQVGSGQVRQPQRSAVQNKRGRRAYTKRKVGPASGASGQIRGKAKR